jgi:uncharacterized protein
VRLEWDDAENLANQKKHGVSFEEAAALFDDEVDCLEIFDEQHSDAEDRFISIGPIERGLVLVVWTERVDDVIRIISARWTTKREGELQGLPGAAPMTDDMPELTDDDFASAIPARLRKRLIKGQFESGEDIAALRRFVRLTQEQFAQAMGISVHTLRNWEQGRRTPEGPALALLRIAAKHPRIIRENLESAA